MAVSGRIRYELELRKDKEFERKHPRGPGGRWIKVAAEDLLPGDRIAITGSPDNPPVQSMEVHDVRPKASRVHVDAGDFSFSYKRGRKMDVLRSGGEFDQLDPDSAEAKQLIRKMDAAREKEDRQFRRYMAGETSASAASRARNKADEAAADVRLRIRDGDLVEKGDWETLRAIQEEEKLGKDKEFERKHPRGPKGRWASSSKPVEDMNAVIRGLVAQAQRNQGERRLRKAWDEEAHPRGKGGRWIFKLSGVSSALKPDIKAAGERLHTSYPNVPPVTVTTWGQLPGGFLAGHGETFHGRTIKLDEPTWKTKGAFERRTDPMWDHVVDPTPEGLIAHEFGHEVRNYATQQVGKREVSRELRKLQRGYPLGVSGRGRVNDDEAFAEAFVAWQMARRSGRVRGRDPISEWGRWLDRAVGAAKVKSRARRPRNR